jgi:hypothetical protein
MDLHEVAAPRDFGAQRAAPLQLAEDLAFERFDGDEGILPAHNERHGSSRTTCQSSSPLSQNHVCCTFGIAVDVGVLGIGQAVGAPAPACRLVSQHPRQKGWSRRACSKGSGTTMPASASAM